MLRSGLLIAGLVVLLCGCNKKVDYLYVWHSQPEPELGHEARPSCSLTASAEMVKVGEPITLELKTRGKVTSATLDGAAIAFPEGRRTISKTTGGKFTARAEVRGPGGTFTCVADYEVRDESPSCLLTVDHSKILPQQPLTFTMMTFGKVTSATLEEVAINHPMGTRTIVPTTEGSFTAHGKVVGPGGTGACEVKYLVLSPPPRCTLTASPASLGVGDSLTLTLRTEGTVNDASIDGQSVSHPTGTRVVTAMKAGSFSAHGSVTGPGGTATCDTNYQVIASPPSCALTASASSIEVGKSVTLVLQSRGNVKQATIDGLSVGIPTGQRAETPTSAGTFTAQGIVTGPEGTATCTVNYQAIVSPPSCTLTATPPSVDVGQSVTLVLRSHGDVKQATIDGLAVGIPTGQRTETPNSAGSFTAQGIVSGAGGTALCTATFDVKNIVHTFQPALAVAGSGCMMCHSKVTSNVITTFGYGDPYYCGGKSVALAFTGSIYGDMGGGAPPGPHPDPSPAPSFSNWGTASITGKILIPKADLPPQLEDLGITQKTLAEYLGVTVPKNDSGVKPEINEMKKIFIGAPTTEQMLAKAGTFPAEHPDWTYLPSSGSTIPFQGLESVSGYLHNSGELACDGDLVIKDKVLYLERLRLRTSSGCRIYAAGRSVILHGAIEYVGGDPKRNLQITSSRAILAGLGKGPVQLHGTQGDSDTYRLRGVGFVDSYYTHAFPDDPRPNLDAILSDQQSISGLMDAEKESGGRKVSFSRLLLNAPVVQSRYNGDFSGVIIGEVVLGSLGDFVFKFDPIFSQVPVLPLVPESSYLDLEPLARIEPPKFGPVAVFSGLGW